MRSFRYATSALVILASTSLASAQTYRITDLGAVSGVGAGAVAINASGVVVGNSANASGVVTPFIWKNGVRTSLGTFGTDATYAKAINASGLIVGGTVPPDPKGYYGQAFRWSNGSYNHADPKLVTNVATGVNDAGVIALNKDIASRNAALYQNGTTTQLPYIPEESDPSNPRNYSRVNAVNNLGQAVGKDNITIYDNNGDFPTFWADGVETIIPRASGHDRGEALGMNDTGMVVGYGTWRQGEFPSAWVWKVGDATATRILFSDFAYSWAYGVNDLGTVVGTMYYDNPAAGRNGPGAFVYRNGQAALLDSLLDPSSMGWMLTDARGINDLGQIVGSGIINGQAHAFLATPVPEPATMAALGLAAFAALRRRRR